MIFYKTDDEVELMRTSALLVSATLTEVAKVLKPGMTTMDIDKLANEFINDNNAIPSFFNYGGFPYHICTSVNDVVVHGFPNQVALREGDIVSVDVGVIKNGFHGDHAYTFILGETSPEIIKLVKTTKDSLFEGIKYAIAGNRLGEISNAIQQYNEKQGYGVVRDLVGHGLGRSMHEDPQVPNFGKKNGGIEMKKNLVLAIEPMVNMGTYKVTTDSDGWVVRTADRLPSVHFEHDVCVKADAALILSDYTPIEKAEKANGNLNSSYYN